MNTTDTTPETPTDFGPITCLDCGKPYMDPRAGCPNPECKLIEREEAETPTCRCWRYPTGTVLNVDCPQHGPKAETPTAGQDGGAGPISAKDLADMPKALLILAAQIQAPDHLPSMCLKDAAAMIQSLASQLAQAQQDTQALRNRDAYRENLILELRNERSCLRAECERLREDNAALRAHFEANPSLRIQEIDRLREENAELAGVLYSMVGTYELGGLIPIQIRNEARAALAKHQPDSNPLATDAKAE